MKYKYLIIILVSVLLFENCTTEFLEVDPLGSVSSDNYLKNEEEVKKAMIGVYDYIQRIYGGAGNVATPYLIKGLIGDDSQCGGSNSSDQPGLQHLDDYLIVSGNDKLTTLWQFYYKIINSCNTIVFNVEGYEGNTEEMNNMVAEAKGIRALIYSDLVSIFGEVPLFVENPSSEETFHNPRAGINDVYAQIEKDLNEAIVGLKTKSEYSVSDKFRFSKGAAKALLGKVYLYQEKYSDAANVLEELIATEEYDLEPNFEDVWTAKTEFGIESVFEVSYTTSEAYDWGTYTWFNDESSIIIQLMGPREEAFNVKNSSLGIINGWGFNVPSKKIGDLFISEGETTRYRGTLISQSDFIATGGLVIDEKAHDYQGYIRLKYVTRSSSTNIDAVAELNHGTNWRVIRYADVLLMAAEAYNRIGEDGKAQLELIKVRKRAGFNEPITAIGDELFNLIVKERQLELAFEGFRWVDLVRWGLADQELSYKGFEKGKNEVMPIPLIEINSNQKISPADQNNGY